jgi:MOSC domain-containing protein YiiM
MKIVEVCVGMPKRVRHGRKDVVTGIFKSPVAGPVLAGLQNLDGDRQADLSVHGGRDKSLYAYPVEHYVSWASEMGVDALEPSQFGENLTVSGMTERTVIIGDRYRIGNAVATVTQPRLPCFKLGIRMADDDFPNRLLTSGRLGFYLRVEEQGTLQKGDGIELLQRPDHGISVFDLWHMVFKAEPVADQAQRAMDSLPHIDAGWIRRLKRICDSAARRR